MNDQIDTPRSFMAQPIFLFDPYDQSLMDEVLHYWVGHKYNLLLYYNQVDLSAYDEHSGRRHAQQRSDAEDAYLEAQQESRDYVRWWACGKRVCYIPFTEFSAVLIQILIEYMQAAQYATSSGQLYSAYKQALKALHLLRKINPDYQHVSARYFINRSPLSNRL